MSNRPLRFTPTTRLSPSVSTPYQLANGVSVSQFSLSTQSGPFVAWYRATSGARSGLNTVIFAVPSALPATAVIVAFPSPTPRTRPDVSTLATDSSLEDHANSAPATNCRLASNACAVIRRVSPTTTVSAEGDTVTERATCITIANALPEIAPEVAVIVAVPLPSAVTNPAESTGATCGSLLAHVTTSSGIGRPIWSRTSAVSRTVSPSASNTTVSGVTATVVGAGTTTTSCARPVTPDEVAETSTSPTATPATNPVPSTTATVVSLDAHENPAPATPWPFASLASATRRSVSPNTSVSAAGVTSTVLTRWATVTVALPEADPAVAVIVAVPFPAAVTRPDPFTVATAVLLLAQVTVTPPMTCPL